MSGLTDPSLTSMKAAFPTAPDPIQGIPMLASLIDPVASHLLMFADTQDTCLGYYEHIILCRVTRSLFFLHKQYLPFKFFIVSS